MKYKHIQCVSQEINSMPIHQTNFNVENVTGHPSNYEIFSESVTNTSGEIRPLKMIEKSQQYRNDTNATGVHTSYKTPRHKDVVKTIIKLCEGKKLEEETAHKIGLRPKAMQQCVLDNMMISAQEQNSSTDIHIGEIRRPYSTNVHTSSDETRTPKLISNFPANITIPTPSSINTTTTPRADTKRLFSAKIKTPVDHRVPSYHSSAIFSSLSKMNSTNQDQPSSSNRIKDGDKAPSTISPDTFTMHNATLQLNPLYQNDTSSSNGVKHQRDVNFILRRRNHGHGLPGALRPPKILIRRYKVPIVMTPLMPMNQNGLSNPTAIVGGPSLPIYTPLMGQHRRQKIEDKKERRRQRKQRRKKVKKSKHHKNTKNGDEDTAFFPFGSFSTSQQVLAESLQPPIPSSGTNYDDFPSSTDESDQALSNYPMPSVSTFSYPYPSTFDTHSYSQSPPVKFPIIETPIDNAPNLGPSTFEYTTESASLMDVDFPTHFEPAEYDDAVTEVDPTLKAAYEVHEPELHYPPSKDEENEIGNFGPEEADNQGNDLEEADKEKEDTDLDGVEEDISGTNENESDPQGDDLEENAPEEDTGGSEAEARDTPQIDFENVVKDEIDPQFDQNFDSDYDNNNNNNNHHHHNEQ